ncbi:MAG: glycosyltransferase family 4 protein [Candidatus Pacebacteria bacterium]|nr:glycosyltransferase family 4 protein [Candidatus Paceibacterota bacterium]
MNIGLVLHPYGDPTLGGSPGKFSPFVEGIMHGCPDDSFTCYLKGAPRDVRFSSGAAKVLYRFLGNVSFWVTGALKLGSHDIYIFFSPVIPLFFRPKRSILIAQDFAYLALPPAGIWGRALRPVLFFMHKTSLKKASVVLAISQATKDDVVKHFGIAPERVKVMYLGFTPPTVAPAPVVVAEPYFLYVGSLKPRKNVGRIIKGFAAFAKGESAYALVLTGKPSGPYYDSLVSIAKEECTDKQVQFVGRVSDAEVAYLYQHATALVFPTLYEGFGFPIIEAMHWGCPVITSSEGALREVAGDAALLVDPYSPEDIASAMRQLCADPSLREELIRKGRVRAAEFTWDKSVQSMLGTLRELKGALT